MATTENLSSPKRFKSFLLLPIKKIVGNHLECVVREIVGRKGTEVKKAGTSLVVIIAVIIASISIAPFAFASNNVQGASLSGGSAPVIKGMELSKPDKSLKADSMRFASGTLASSVDLSSKAPPIGNQGNQGSCVGWATSYYYKTWLEKSEHSWWDLSKTKYQFSPSFVYNQINGGVDQGASIADAFQLMQDVGCVDLEDFTYDGNITKQPNGNEKEAAKQYRISDNWNYLFAEYWWAHEMGSAYNHDISSLKSWLNSGNPLVMGIPIYSDFPAINNNSNSSYYTSGDSYSSNQFLGGHAVFIAGYDDNANPNGSTPDTRGGFLLLNSWGSNWNGNGRVWISYKFAKKWVPEAWLMEDLSSKPRISSINPETAKMGDYVTITGDNFGSYRRSAAVVFPGLASSPTIRSWCNSEICVKVPGGVSQGDLYIKDWDGYKSNTKPFTPTGTSESWFLAEGSTWAGFDEWVLIQNPNNKVSNVQVTYLTPSGPVQGPTLDVPAMSRVTVHVNESVPNQDVSTVVSVNNGVPVCCERAMYFSTPDGKWGSHDCVASPGIATTWYLAEGATWTGFDEWVLIMNPYQEPVDVKITFQTPSGNVNGPTINLPGGTRYSLHVNDYLPNRDVSTKVECLDITRGVVAERSMYMKTADGKVDCHNSMGVNEASDSWGLAEGATWPGFEEWVLVQNPMAGKPVDVDFKFLTPDNVVKGPTKTVPAGGRISIKVNDYVPNRDVSTMVSTVNSDDKIVVERAMYINTPDGKVGAHNAPASAYISNSWYLPEGCTSPGFDEWVSVMNPGSEESVDVQLTFMTPGGAVAGPKATLKPYSRATFNVNKYVSTGDVSTKVDSDGYILCERSMYVRAADGKAGAHCSLGVLAEYLSQDSGENNLGFKLSEL